MAALQTEVRDLSAYTGLDSPSRILAVAPDGKVMFKQSAHCVFLYDENRGIHTLEMSGLYGLYEKLQVFDMLFMDNVRVAIVFQDERQTEFMVAEAELDLDTRTLAVGKISHTGMRNEPGRKVLLTRDEKGAILLSHKIAIPKGESTKVELFHVANFLRAGHKGSKLVVNTKSTPISNIFTTAFVSRNVLYLFSSLDFGRCLVVPLAGPSCGKCEVRATKGEPPSERFINKTLELFEDFALVYAAQSQNHEEPALFLLDLTYLRWQQLRLRLSEHLPGGNIALRAPSHDAEFAWLHGNCNKPDCSQRSHLYQLDVAQLEYVCRSRSSSLASLLITHSVAGPSNTMLATCQATPTPKAPPTPPPVPKSDPPVIGRFKKRAKTPRSASFASFTEDMCDASVVAACQRRDRPPSIHWAEDMEDGDQDLMEQLKRAKEMGFTDEAVFEAVKRNTPRGEPHFNKFNNINQMLDMLHKGAEKMSLCSNSSSSNESRYGSTTSLDKRPSMKMSIFKEGPTSRNRSSLESPRSPSISRSSSFHMDSPRVEKKATTDIQRMMDTLEKENMRNQKQFMDQIHILLKEVQKLKQEVRGKDLLLDDKEREYCDKLDQLKIRLELEKHKLEKSETTTDNLRQELAAVTEERNQMRDEMQRYVNTATDLQAQLEDKDRMIQDMADNVDRRSTRSSGFRPHCTICLERQPNIALVKCWHLVMCEECFADATGRGSLTTCPNCRTAITGHVRVYY